MTARYTAGRYKAWDDNGDPLPLARLYTYVQGTTTQKNAFTAVDELTPVTYTPDGIGGQYIAMDARGEASLFLSGDYTLTLKTPLGAVIFSDDQDDSALALQNNLAGTGAGQGTDAIGLNWGTSPGGQALGSQPLTVFTRSSPIPLKSAVSSTLVTDGSVDYTAELQAVVNYLRDYGGGKIILPPNANIKVGSVQLYSGVEVFGHDWTSVVSYPIDKYCFMINPGVGGTPNPEDNAKNIALRGFKIVGPVVASGFLESQHAIFASALSWAEFEDMAVTGFRGDGYMFGSSNTANSGTERHNEHIKIIRGMIDGLNKDNRNGVSIIDCTDFQMDGTLIRNTTRSNMPGAFDIEPDSNIYHRVKNIHLRNVQIKNCGGNVASVTLALPDVAWQQEPSNFLFENIEHDSPLSNFFAMLRKRNAAAVASGNRMKIRIMDNTSVSSNRDFILEGLKDTYMSRNKWGGGNGSLIGFDTANSKVIDLVSEDDEWDKVASAPGTGNAVSIFTVDGVTLKRPKFIDCGTGVAGFANAITFADGPSVAAVSSRIKIIDPEFYSPTGKTLKPFQKEAGHTLTPGSNEFSGAQLFDGLTTNDSEFPAYIGDQRNFWTPIVAGGTTDGARTGNSIAVGYFNCSGRPGVTKFQIDVDQLSHTGTGIVEIGLPPIPPQSNPGLMPCSVEVIGVALTAGDQFFAGINTSANVPGGTGGAIQLYKVSSAGVQSAVVVPAGAARYRISGEYWNL
jgi:hypothetical protein